MDKALKQAKPQLQVSAVYFPRGNLTKIQKHIPVFSRLGACRIQSNGEEHEELRVSGFLVARTYCAAAFVPPSAMKQLCNSLTD